MRRNLEKLKLSRTEEVWVQITDEAVPGIKPYYYISNWGRVGSIAYGEFQLLSPAKDLDGYLMVLLRIYPIQVTDIFVRGRVTVRVNRLVMMSFYPIPEGFQELEVNHKNNIRDDNHLWNLEWITGKENVHYAMKYGKLADFKGETHPSAKLTDEDVYKIVKVAKSGKYNFKQMAEMFNVTPRTIENIVYKRNWTHLNLDISVDDLAYNRRLAFSNEELEAICSFFEKADINNKTLYPLPIVLLRECFYTLGLDKKYNFKSKKNTLFRILIKDIPYIKNITDKYSYKFIR